MSKDLYRQVAQITSFTERYILSVFYLTFAYVDFQVAHVDWVGRHAWTGPDFLQFAQDFTMFLMMFFEGATLLIARRAVTTPRNLAEIFFPLAASFFYLTYQTIPLLPPWAQNCLLPENWWDTLTVTGLAMDFLGAAISTWGVVYLGRSFGIFVAVRKVVLRGPYRFVRHPIYSGYMFIFAGLAVTYFSPAAFVLVGIHFALFVYRARLEEARLAEFSPEYREHQKRTGFVLPKLHLARPES